MTTLTKMRRLASAGAFATGVIALAGPALSQDESLGALLEAAGIVLGNGEGGGSQPVICMVKPTAGSDMSDIAVIAQSEEQCGAIGGTVHSD
jgi:hypothetical protein